MTRVLNNVSRCSYHDRDIYALTEGCVSIGGQRGQSHWTDCGTDAVTYMHEDGPWYQFRGCGADAGDGHEKVPWKDVFLTAMHLGGGSHDG